MPDGPVQLRPSHHADRMKEHSGVIFTALDALAYRKNWQTREQLVVDVGCFDGTLLQQAAAANPQFDFVGIDWKAGALCDAADRFKQLGLDNVRLIHGRGQDIAAWFTPGEVDEIWLFHPDPCDRPIEWPHRLMNPPWLLDAATALKPGGSLCLKTDHVGYYQWSLAVLGETQPDWTSARKHAHRERVDESTLPGCWNEARDRFEVVGRSEDFWHDAGLQEMLKGRAFWNLRSGFEERFAKKHWPIYWVELCRR